MFGTEWCIINITIYVSRILEVIGAVVDGKRSEERETVLRKCRVELTRIILILYRNSI